MTGASNSLTGRARIARSASLSLFKYAYAFVPTASSTEKIRIVGLPNNAPMNTISADMPTSSPAVFSPFEYRCTVASSLVELSRNQRRNPGTRSLRNADPYPGATYRQPTRSTV